MDLKIETQLIIDAQNNIQAFAQLYDYYFPIIFSYCLNRTGSKEIAEDVTSQTLLKSIETIKKFDFNKSSRLGPLLYRMAHNFMIDFYKKNNRNTAFDSNTEVKQLATDGDETERSAELSLLQTQIITVLDMINERYAQIIALKFYSEMNAAEIGIAMDIKSSHVPVVLFRALESFREKFKETYPDTETFYSI